MDIKTVLLAILLTGLGLYLSYESNKEDGIKGFISLIALEFVVVIAMTVANELHFIR